MEKQGSKETVAVVKRGATKEDRLVSEAVTRINGIWNGGIRNTVVELGDYLLKTFFNGSLEAASSHNPFKGSPMRKLLERVGELPVTAHQLKVAVRVAVQVRELPSKTAEALTVSHHELLALVRDPAQRDQVAAEAVEKKWSVKRLEARVRKLQPPRAGGRKPLHPLEKGLLAVVRALSAQDIADGLSVAGLRSLDAAQLRTIDIQARRARELLEQITDGVDRKLRS